MSGHILWHVGMPCFYVLVPEVCHSVESDLYNKLVNGILAHTWTLNVYRVSPVSTLVN